MTLSSRMWHHSIGLGSIKWPSLTLCKPTYRLVDLPEIVFLDAVLIKYRILYSNFEVNDSFNFTIHDFSERVPERHRYIFGVQRVNKIGVLIFHTPQ